MFNKCFLKIVLFMRQCGKNMVEPDGPQMKTECSVEKMQSVYQITSKNMVT